METQWPLVLFTFFLSLCGGILFFQGLLTVLGKGKKMQLVSLIAALIALGIGGISVFTHLQHWERIFNGFSALIMGKGEYGMSGIGLEMWGCVIFAIALVLYFLFMRRSEDGMAPKWCGILAMVVGIALPAVTGDSYLMPSLPAWNTPMLIAYYILNTLCLGSVAAMVIAHFTKCDDAADLLAKVALVSLVIQCVLIIVYAFYVTSLGGDWTSIEYYFDPTLPDIHMVDEVSSVLMITGTRGLVFWLGAVVLGCACPAVLLLLDWKKFNFSGNSHAVCTIVSIVTIIAGSFIWRVLLYEVAISAFALY